MNRVARPLGVFVAAVTAFTLLLWVIKLENDNAIREIKEAQSHGR